MKFKNIVEKDVPKLYEGWTEKDNYSIEELETYIKNHGETSFLVEDGDKTIAGILAGHDGLNGYIHHIQVEEAYRKNGVGEKLLDCAVKSLMQRGIKKCHVLIDGSDTLNRRYWVRKGFERQDSVYMYSKNLD